VAFFLWRRTPSPPEKSYGCLFLSRRPPPPLLQGDFGPGLQELEKAPAESSKTIPQAEFLFPLFSCPRVWVEEEVVFFSFGRRFLEHIILPGCFPEESPGRPSSFFMTSPLPPPSPFFRANLPYENLSGLNFKISILIILPFFERSPGPQAPGHKGCVNLSEGPFFVRVILSIPVFPFATGCRHPFSEGAPLAGPRPPLFFSRNFLADQTACPP